MTVAAGIASPSVRVSGPFESTMYHLFVSARTPTGVEHRAFLAYQLHSARPGDPDQRSHVIARSIWVAEPHRRSGYGRTLVRRLVALYPPGVYRWTANPHTAQGWRFAQTMASEVGVPDGALTLVDERTLADRYV